MRSTTAGHATIITNSGGGTTFFDNTDGGTAQFITIGTGDVDFAGSLGPNRRRPDHRGLDRGFGILLHRRRQHFGGRQQ